KKRQSQGFQTTLLKTTDILTPAEITANDARKLQARLRNLFKDSPQNTYILLVGAEGLPDRIDLPGKAIPLLPATTGRMQRKPTDNAFATTPDSLMPKVPLGRLPARTDAEARAMIAKILTFEDDLPTAPWRRDITLLVGNPGGTSTAEKLL